MARRAGKGDSPSTGAGTDPGTGDGEVKDYRYQRAKRKNNPPAGLATQGRIAERPIDRYSYDPHLPPVLRFDSTGQSDRLPELLETARQRALTPDEVTMLAAALRVHEPWLEWTGKRERKGFETDPVPLHIHERVATKAILAVAERRDVQRSLFADPELEYRQAVQFYQHDVDWANRLILGDSLLVMNSLAKREDLAGKVQMVYLDPPYGIKFASNFQPQVGQRNVSDRPADLTREPEVVKAYRDTWTLGIHSYLTYLRDRLTVAKELLTDSGSIFVQIGDENVHLVRTLLDEVFGRENFCSLIPFAKTSGQTPKLLSEVNDYLLWYAKHKEIVRYHQIFQPRELIDNPVERYVCVETPDGEVVDLTYSQKVGESPTPDGRILKLTDLTSQTGGESSRFEVEFSGRAFLPSANRGWSTSRAGVETLRQAGLLHVQGSTIWWKNYRDTFPFRPLRSNWDDVKTNAFGDPRYYVVQTGTRVIQRCMLMTTCPGDLVLDPTCGSGTTAYVAEQWGRRWIAIDTSRVALAIARQRLLTASFDFYRLRDASAGPSGGFRYKSVPHITLKSIAQNVALDPIFARHAPVLAERLAALNAALAALPSEVRASLATKLARKEQQEGKRSVTDADRRRWLLPKQSWQEWEVPFDTDPDWPRPLQEALVAYRAAWRAKRDEVDRCIAASAENEDLVDQPEIIKGVVRVSGPFTVESVLPPEEHAASEPSPVDEPDEELLTFGANGSSEGDGYVRPLDPADEPTNLAAYLDRMLRLLRADGVRFPDNKTMSFARLDGLSGDVLHAEGEWASADGSPRQVAVSFGPQYGPVTAPQVEECLRAAYRRDYDDVVFAGFSFDAAAQAIIQDDPNPHVRAHLAHIRPDVNLGNLLKETPSSQLFTVFGLPRTRLDALPDGQWTVTMEGVDVYDPTTNTVASTGASKVAAWFLDSDYDGRTFCICQAFFPDRSAWDKLARALKSVVDEGTFEQFSGTTSVPFPTGRHRRIAVKVIDPRGNEVLRVLRLGQGVSYA